MLKHTRSKQWTNTTRLNLVTVLPSLSLRHIQMFKSTDEYGDKTQLSDGLAIFIVTDTLKCSKQWTNMATKLNGVMVLLSCIVKHTQMFKAMDEY